MKSRRLLAVLLIVALALVPLFPSRAAGGSVYTEKLTVFIAGTNALWSLNLGGINASNAYLKRLESVQGLSWYNVTGIKTTGWTSDFQVFGPQGYNLIKLPSIPQQGVILSVGAPGYGAAASAAQVLDPYFLSVFTSISNGSGVFSFFAPISFGTMMPMTLMKFIPVSNGGFASALGYTSPTNPGNFTGVPGAMVTLEGQSTSSGFSHSLTLSGMVSSALSASKVPSITNYFGTTLADLQASNKSSSSVIVVHALDGIVSPGNLTTVSNNLALFTGTYSLSVLPGSLVRSLNVSLIQQPPELLITRSFDAGVLAHGQNVSVTVTFRNLSNASTIYGATLADTWWQSYGFFKQVSGNSSTIVLPKLLPGAIVNPTYELQYTGNSTQQVQIPVTTASYTLVTSNVVNGKSTGSNLTLFSDVNGGILNLGQGVQEPAVFAYLSTSTGIGGPVGSAQGLRVVVKNVGTRTANSVVVNGKQIGALPAGGTETVPISVRAPSLVLNNVTERSLVSYITPEGQNISLGTNSVNLVFAHGSMNLGLGVLSLNSTYAQLSGGRTNITLLFTTTNKGVANVTSFSASGALPAGLSCGKVTGKNVTCSAGSVTLSYTSMKSKASELASMSFVLAQPSNIVFSPFACTFSSSGYVFSGVSNADPVPSGLSLSKSFNPDLLFGGMSSSATLAATNSGPYPLYNATISTTKDAFDFQPSGSSLIQATNGTVSAGSTLSHVYNVTMASTPGNQTGTVVAASFYFGGMKFSTNDPSERVVIYKPLEVSITPIPASPVEGKSFSIQITITNPSPISITNVQFSLPIPSEVRVLSANNASFASGKIMIDANSLGKSAVYTATLTVSSNSGVSIPFSGEKLTFTYAGQSVKGPELTAGIAINENVLTRYLLPIGLALVVLLAVAVLVRRMAKPSVPASQK